REVANTRPRREARRDAWRAASATPRERSLRLAAPRGLPCAVDPTPGPRWRDRGRRGGGGNQRRREVLTSAEREPLDQPPIQDRIVALEVRIVALEGR